MIASLESAGVEVDFVDALTPQRSGIDPRLRLQGESLSVRDGEAWVALGEGVSPLARVVANERFAIALWGDEASETVLRVFDLRERVELALPQWGLPVWDATLFDRCVIVDVRIDAEHALIAWDLLEQVERWRRALGVTSSAIEIVTVGETILWGPGGGSLRALDARDGAVRVAVEGVRWSEWVSGDLLLLERRARGLDVVSVREGRALGALVSAQSLSVVGAIDADRLLLQCGRDLQLVQIRPFAVLAGATLRGGDDPAPTLEWTPPARLRIEDRARALALGALDPAAAIEWTPFDDRVNVAVRPLFSRAGIDDPPPHPSRDPARVNAIMAVIDDEGARLSAVFERCVARGLVDAGFDPRTTERPSRAVGGLFRWTDGDDDVLRAFATLLCDAEAVVSARVLLRETQRRLQALGEHCRSEIEWHFVAPRIGPLWCSRRLPGEHLIADAVPTDVRLLDVASSHGRARVLDALWQHAVERDLCFAQNSARSLRGRAVREFASPFAPLVALESLGYALWSAVPRWIVSVPLLDPWRPIASDAT